MKLPKDPFKRRRAVFKNIYRHIEVWQALVEREGPDRSVLHIDGEDVDFYSLMEGYDLLPARQKEAFDLHVLQGMSEGAAAKIMFPGSKWSTPVQQYAKSALNRMIQAYDRSQTTEGRNEKAKLKAKRTLTNIERQEKTQKVLQSMRYQDPELRRNSEVRDNLFD